MVYKDWYKKLRDKIQNAKSDKELDDIIDEIYTEGMNDAENECSCGEPTPWGDLD